MKQTAPSYSTTEVPKDNSLKASPARHSLAVAWDEWISTDEGQKCRAPDAVLAHESPFLENRLHRAFDAGAKAQANSGLDTQSLDNDVSLLASRECPCKGMSDQWKYDCADCFGTGLLDFIHYSADATGRPCCIEPDPTTSKESAKVTCPHCLNVIHQRQNMDMGDWLK